MVSSPTPKFMGGGGGNNPLPLLRVHISINTMGGWIHVGGGGGGGPRRHHVFLVFLAFVFAFEMNCLVDVHTVHKDYLKYSLRFGLA